MCKDTRAGLDNSHVMLNDGDDEVAGMGNICLANGLCKDRAGLDNGQIRMSDGDDEVATVR